MKHLVKLFTNKFWPLVLLLAAVVVFFQPFIFRGKLPIPADTIVGMYHPFRDFYASEYPRGIPFKNFLVTDPVRQQYPWRELSVKLLKAQELPLWNPYSFSGTPLLAGLQSAAFYPLNFLFFLLPFALTWGILILFEPFLAGAFLYFYLRNLKLEKLASLLGAVSFAFSGFFVAWLEWGTVLHSALWLPLVLLSTDKIFAFFKKQQNEKLKINNLIIWSAIFVFSLCSSFLAGHLQTSFYVGVVSVAYLLARCCQHWRNIKIILLFTGCYLLFTILTAVQWWPTFQFIALSGRNLDQISWQREGWFIPVQNLIQFLAPDFFGNPATLNYWGFWNYGEFIGYIGILPLILALYALSWRQDKKTLFFGSLFFLSLIFALPTPLAKIPYQLKFPFLSTAQPTRLLFLTDFSLALLSALGADMILKEKMVRKKGMTIVLSSLILVFIGLWFFVIFTPKFWPGAEWVTDLAISKRNLVLPTILFVTSIFLFLLLFIKKMPKKIIILAALLVTIFDLLRFGQKFTPFTENEWLFPKTKTIEFLEKQQKPFRIMTTDPRIFPPNFSVAYRLESVEGYDPLYLQRYGELIAASERKRPNIDAPWGFNRNITPHNFESRIIDLLNVKYVLSFDDLRSKKLKKVFQEGQTQVYENLDVLPRLFFVEKIMVANNKQDVITRMFASDFDPQKIAIVETDKADLPEIFPECKKCKIKLTLYEENKIIAEIENENEGFLVLVDTFYPSWKAKIDGIPVGIYRTDYNFQGILVPKGKHTISVSYSLLP